MQVGSTGFSSSTMAIFSAQYKNGVTDVAYIPQQTKVNGAYAVQEINLDADKFTSLFPVTPASR